VAIAGNADEWFQCHGSVEKTEWEGSRRLNREEVGIKEKYKGGESNE
jgi:hypothetical protein